MTKSLGRFLWSVSLGNGASVNVSWNVHLSVGLWEMVWRSEESQRQSMRVSEHPTEHVEVSALRVQLLGELGVGVCGCCCVGLRNWLGRDGLRSERAYVN